MAQYTVRNPAVDAVQWDGQHPVTILDLLGPGVHGWDIDLAAGIGRLLLTWRGLSFDAEPGDWFVKDAVGNIRTMADGAFRATYAAAGTTENLIVR